MAQPRIFVTRGMVGTGVERLAREADVTVWPDADPPPAEALLEHAARSDGLFTTIADHIDAAFLASAPSVRIVAHGIGMGIRVDF